MYHPTAHNTYTQNNVNIESSNKLIQMLFEGILRFNTQAKRAILHKDIERKTYWLNRSSAVFSELTTILDFKQGDISYYLHGLYSRQLQELHLAGTEANIERLDRVNHVVRSLNEAWKDSTDVA